MKTRTDDELLRKPIIVVGAGRSGMNFLGDVIAQHPTFAVATEPRLIWKHGNDRKSDMLRPEDARPEVIADIRAQFAAVVREQGKERLVDVTPGNSVRLGFVNRVFPDCQIVHFIRDGVDNVLSMRRFYAVYTRTLRVEKDPDHESPASRRMRQFRIRQLPGLAMEVIRNQAPDWLLSVVGYPVLGVRLPAMSAIRREVDLLEVCFQQWRSSVEMAAQFGRPLLPNRYMECRIESFSVDDVREIYDFCGIELTQQALDFATNKFQAQRIGPAKQDAFPEELSRLKLMVEPTMLWIEQRTPVRRPAASNAAGEPAPRAVTAESIAATEKGP